MKSAEHLLFIEPQGRASNVPNIDRITRKMCAAFRDAKVAEVYRGIHECSCGAWSDAANHVLPSGESTNSLCVHYLAHHRDEVPESQLDQIRTFPVGDLEPTDQELQGPKHVHARIKSAVLERLDKPRLDKWIEWGLDLDLLFETLRDGGGGSHGQLHKFETNRLLDLIISIDAGSLEIVRNAILREHEVPQAWGESALRIPSWSRQAWVSPLVAIIEFGEPDSRHSAAMRVREFRQHAGPAVQKLLELANRFPDDPAYQYDLSQALRFVGGEALLSQIPPRPGQVGVCSYCQGSGDCYCKRKGLPTESCDRCKQTGVCHVCKGEGRRHA